MNFCEESDNYISLYIDEMLEEKEEKEFLKHIGQCAECAQKLKEESYFADLCKNDEAVKLPPDFSASLHARLLEVNEKESKFKKNFLYNKKIIAGLSTAAVLAVSLLAYSLIPKIGISKDEMSMSAADDRTTAASVSSAESAGAPRQEQAQAVRQEPEKAAADDLNGDIKFSKGQAGSNSEISDTDREAEPSANKQQIAGTAEAGALKKGETVKTKSSERTQPLEETQQTAEKKAPNTPEEDQVRVTIALTEDEKVEYKSTQYVSNYSELDLIVSSVSDYDNLKQFMAELGAAEQKNILYGTTAGITGVPEYTDYTLPLALYDSLKFQALTKYSLQLVTKTDIIKNDITSEYNELNSQKLEVQKKIDETLSRGEDAAALENEKLKLTDEINKLTDKKDMITVRIFFINK